MTAPTVLDPCCGSRMMWFDRQNPTVLFGDCRAETVRVTDRSHGKSNGSRIITIEPDTLMDFRALPFPDGSFRLVILTLLTLSGLGGTHGLLQSEDTHPVLITLENVEEFQSWGPLDKDGHPIRAQAGQTFRAWARRLRRLGYTVAWRLLRACDYGAPTTRKRLFVVARRDGGRIVWPRPTHGAPESPEVQAGKHLPWRTAAECIDWSIQSRSIFDRAKPLALNTQRRIAEGLRWIWVDGPRLVRCDDVRVLTTLELHKWTHLSKSTQEDSC